MQIIGLVISKKIRKNRGQKQTTNNVETGERNRVAFELFPDVGPKPLDNDGSDRRRRNTLGGGRRSGIGDRSNGPGLNLIGAHCCLRPNAIRGSTIASNKSESRIPINVRTALTLNRAITVG